MLHLCTKDMHQTCVSQVHMQIALRTGCLGSETMYHDATDHKIIMFKFCKRNLFIRSPISPQMNLSKISIVELSITSTLLFLFSK